MKAKKEFSILVGGGAFVMSLLMILVMGLVSRCQAQTTPFGWTCPNAPKQPFIQSDKQKHIIASAVIYTVSEQGLYYLGQKNSEIKAVAIALSIGIGKELVWDKWMQKGTPDWGDFGADCVGLIGAGLITYPINRMLRKKRVPIQMRPHPFGLGLAINLGRR